MDALGRRTGYPCEMVNESPDEQDITPAQLRAARALLGWSQSELASRTGIARRTIFGIESGERRAHKGTLDALLATFLREGIEFTNNAQGYGTFRRLRSESGG